jgi:PAS domain S-box-containing protein
MAGHIGMDDPPNEDLATTQLRERIADLEASSAVLDSVLDCIITMDADGKVIEFNAASERTFGYTKAEAIGHILADLIIPPALRDAHAAGLAVYLATGQGQLLGKLIRDDRQVEARRLSRQTSPIASGNQAHFEGVLALATV